MTPSAHAAIARGIATAWRRPGERLAAGWVVLDWEHATVSAFALSAGTLCIQVQRPADGARYTRHWMRDTVAGVTIGRVAGCHGTVPTVQIGEASGTPRDAALTSPRLTQ